MFFPFTYDKPLSVGLRAGGRWLNWAKSTPILPIWESPFDVNNHLRPCKPDNDLPKIQEVNIDDNIIYTSDSIIAFADNQPIQLMPIPPGKYGERGPYSFINDSNFELIQVGDTNFKYSPTGSPWTFMNGSGISSSKSAFTTGSPDFPNGKQVAFLQGLSSFSQTISGWTIGTYILTFFATQRVSSQKTKQQFSVLIDDIIVGTFVPTANFYQKLVTVPFSITAGSHIVTFKGLNPDGGDNTAFIDSVSQFKIY